MTHETYDRLNAVTINSTMSPEFINFRLHIMTECLYDLMARVEALEHGDQARDTTTELRTPSRPDNGGAASDPDAHGTSEGTWPDSGAW